MILFGFHADVNGQQSSLTEATSNEETPQFIVPSQQIRSAKTAGTLQHPELSLSNFNAPLDITANLEAAQNRANCLVTVDENTWTQFPANDDGSLGPISLPFSFDLYGETYNEVYINNNGNITFDNGYWWYSPDGFPITTPMIAPFWGDVDTRTGDGEVWYYVDDHAFYVSWNQVGPYNAYGGYADGLANTFQVILTDGTDPVLDPGHNVGFRYGDMNWTTGSASGGTSGFGGTPATVGVNSGDGTNYILLGLFDNATSDYDGPTGNNDGVAWLSDQCFDFAVTSAGNLPPTAVGFPANNTLELCQGETTTLDISFTGPESNETVSVSIDDQGNGGYTVNSNTSGNPGVMNLTFGPLMPGTYQYTFTGTDNHPNPESTSRTLTVVVNDLATCSNVVPCTYSIPSSDGYTVEVTLYPIELELPETCEFGYNYDVLIGYDIAFTGNNIPSNVWTLYATLGCGPDGFYVDLPTSAGSGFVLTTSNQWTSDIDCATATPESRECTDWELVINGPGINYQTLECQGEYLGVMLDCPDDIVVTDDDEDCEEVVSNTAPEIINLIDTEPTFEANYMTIDDNNEYVAVSNMFYQGNYPEHTVETWIRTDRQNNQIIASFDRSEYWRLEINGNGAGNGQIGWCVNTDSGIEDMGSATRVDDGEWHHIVATYDNGAMRIFIDGVLDAVSTRGSTMGSNTTRYGFVGTGSEADTYNGSRGPNDYFEGDIASLRVWNRAFSESEIETLYCPDRNDPDLLLWYEFTEGTGSVVNDLSSYGNDGNMISMEPANWQTGPRPGCYEVYNDLTAGADATDTYPVGTTTVNWSLIDPTGTIHSCVQNVTVNQLDPESICTEEFNDYVWNGTVDNDWNNEANWFDGEVPPTGANVTIDVVTHEPEINMTLTLNNLLIEDGSNIDFTSGFGNIKLTGDLANQGALDLADGKITFIGDDTQFIKGANTPIFNDLRVDVSDTLRLLVDIDLFGAMQPDDGVFDWNGREVTLRSDADRTGSIGEIKSGATILGDTISYERYFPAAGGSWRMICSPITDATFEQWNDDIPTTGFPGSDFPTYGGADNPWSNLRRYDETVTEGNLHTGFESIEGMSDVITNTQGVFAYFIPGPTMFDMRGAFHKGDVIYDLSYTNSGTGFINDGWNLVANPYPSAIDWTDLLGVTRTGLDNAIYAYDPINGQYASFVNGISIGLLDNTIGSFQAFWVKANSNNPTLTLTERAKIDDGGVFMRSEDLETQAVVRLRLNTDNEEVYDETVLGFRFGATEGFDTELDAYKFFASNEALPSLASVPDTLSESAMSIAMLPVPEEDMVIELNFKPGSNSELTMENILVDSYDADMCFVLEDRELETFVSFNEGDTYAFEVTDNTTEDRFALHVSAPIDAMVFHESCEDADDGKIIAQGFGEAPWDFTWFDEMGNVIRETEGSTVADVYEDLTPGFYEVLVENDSEHCNTATRIVQVEPAPAAFIEPSSTVASCNQVANGQINLIVSEDHEWSATISGTNIEPIEIESFTGDSVLTDLPFGIYTIEATNNCDEVVELDPIDLRDPSAVNANFAPMSDNISLSNGGVASFMNSSSPNATQFFWDFGDGTVDSTSTAPLHTYQNWGTYDVMLIAKTQNCTDTAFASITVTGMPSGNGGALEDMTALSDQEIVKGDFNVIVSAEELKLYPEATVESTVTVQIFNLNGQIMLSEELNGLEEGGTTLNIGSLNAGLYTLNVFTAEEQLDSREFIKQ